MPSPRRPLAALEPERLMTAGDAERHGVHPMDERRRLGNREPVGGAHALIAGFEDEFRRGSAPGKDEGLDAER